MSAAAKQQLDLRWVCALVVSLGLSGTAHADSADAGAKSDASADAAAADAGNAGQIDEAAAEAARQAKLQEEIAQREAEAAAERQAALEAAERARSEALRLVAEERARWLQVAGAQARFEASLVERDHAIETYRETALGWKRRVRDLPARDDLAGQTNVEADHLYLSLVQDLTAYRNALGDTLAAIQAGDSEAPTLPPPPDEDLPELATDEELRDLRLETQDRASELRTREAAQRWDQAKNLRDAIVTMNQARLQLMRLISPERRSELQEFGSAGLKQVLRELSQITLELRYHILSFPRYARAQLQNLRDKPGASLWGMFQLLLVLLAFRWWRSRADGLLESIRRSWLRKRPQTELSHAVASLVWYIKAIRNPLEWLLLAVTIAVMFRGLGQLGEFRYIWLIVMWILVGALVVRLLDAIAQRQGRSSAELSQLRFRSLNLLGVCVVVVGLILSLASASVGKGAIYSWVIRSFWVLALPIAGILLAWWHATIYERAKAANGDQVLTWVAQQEGRGFNVIGTAIGGIYLLGTALYNFVLRRASDVTVTRRLLAYLFRREIEKTSKAVPEEAARALDPDVCEAVGPGPAQTAQVVAAYQSKAVAHLRTAFKDSRGDVTAIVGERGLGKTTFMERATRGLEEGEVCYLSCTSGGIQPLKQQMAAELGLETNDPETSVLVDAFNESALRVVCIDNTERMIKPVIGGLQDIDALLNLLHQVHDQIDWLVAIDLPAWRFLSRARADRMQFDDVIELSAWDDEQIEALIERRLEIAQLRPDFDRIRVPRHVDSIDVAGEGRSRRDFYRILWDYSDGNPAVALHFLCESLYQHPPAPEVFVRLFQSPPISDIEELPSAVHFVMRSLIQLGQAREEDVARCTNLNAAEVADALRFALTYDYVERIDGHYQVTLHWYRAITDVLRRQHLIWR